MLDLNSRIHLDEVPTATVGVEDELDGAGALVFQIADQRDGSFRHLPPHVRRQHGRRGFFDKLLMPALDAAIALPQMHGIAVFVSEDLDLDMPHFREKAFEINLRIAERRRSLGRRLGEESAKLVHARGNPHPASAAAARRLQQQRKADLSGNLRRRLCVGKSLRRTRHDRDAVARGDPPRFDLVAHRADCFRARADKSELLLAAARGERTFLRKESVARVNRVTAATTRRLDERGSVQIA